MDSDSEDHSPVRSWARESGTSIRQWVIVNCANNSLVDPCLLVKRLFNSHLPREEVLELATATYRLARSLHRSHWIYLFQRDMTSMLVEEEIVDRFPNIESGKNIRVPRRRTAAEYDPAPCRDIRENVSCVRFDEGAGSEIPEEVRVEEGPTSVAGQDLPVEYPAPERPKSILKRKSGQYERSRRQERRYERAESPSKYRSRSRSAHKPQGGSYVAKQDRRRSERRDWSTMYDREARPINRERDGRYREENITSQVFYNSNVVPWEENNRSSRSPKNTSRDKRLQRESTPSRQPRVVVRIPKDEEAIIVQNSRVDRHVQFEGPTTSTSNATGKPNYAHSACPIAECNIRKPRMKWHVYTHFPKYMRITSDPSDACFDDARRQALLLIAGVLIGQKASLGRLVEFVNRRWISTVVEIAPEIREAVHRLHTLIGLPWHKLLLNPVSSPAALIHFRVFAFLLNLLAPVEKETLFQIQTDQRAIIKTKQPAKPRAETPPSKQNVIPLYPNFEDQEEMEVEPNTVEDTDSIDSSTELRLLGLSSKEGEKEEETRSQSDDRISSPVVAVETTTKESHNQTQPADCPKHLEVTKENSWATVVKKSRPKATPVAKPTNSPNPGRVEVASDKTMRSAFDSHFHLNRIGWRKGTKLSSPEEAMRMAVGRQPEEPVSVTQGVMVFCDPEEFESVEFRYHPNWRIAVGIHPKKVSSMEEAHMDQFMQLLSSPRVAAVGEIGLDYTTPESQWEAQEEFLNRILSGTIGCLGRVLVLHVRGRHKKDPHGTNAFAKCLEIVKRHCNKYQRMHLHCFNGNCDTLKAWGSSFPNCYFGFTGLVKDFDAKQRKALVAVDPARLLIETDSPYLAVHSDQDINTPAFIGDVAFQVARVRIMPIEEVMRITFENGRNLYGFHSC